MKKITTLILLFLMGGMFAQVAPVLEWNAKIGGLGYATVVKSTTDTEGNIYSIGSYTGSIDFNPNIPNAQFTAVGGNDIFVSKHNSDGKLLWSKSFGGSEQDVGRSLAIDSNNNLIICGSIRATAVFGTFSLTSNGEEDAFLAKLNTFGEVLWAFNIGSNTYDWFNDVVVARDNSIYVSGNLSIADFDPSANVTMSQAINQDVVVAKYDANGNFLIVKTMSGPTNFELGEKLTLDTKDNIILIGFYTKTLDFDPSANTFNITSNGMRDMFLAKYDANLNFIWAKGFGGTADDEARTVVVDAFDNIYFSGIFKNTVNFDPSATSKILTSRGDNDTFISKFDSSGKLIWIEQIGSTLADGSRGLVLNNNDLYIGGSFNSTVQFGNSLTDALVSNGGLDVFIAKYDTNGVRKWTEHFGSVTDDLCYGLNFHGSEKLYVIGNFTNTIDFDLSAANSFLTSDGGTDGFIAKYNINCFQPANPVLEKSTIGICYDESVTLKATGEGNLEWYAFPNGNELLANGNSFTTPKLTENKTYYVQDRTCTTSERIPVVVTVNSLIDNTTNLIGNTITANQKDASYQWINCNNPDAVLDNANSESFVPTVDGSYAVIVTLGNCSKTSDCITISNLSVKNNNLNSFSIFPNPSNGIFNISLENTMENSKISVYDLNGRNVYKSKTLDTNKKELDLNHLQSGIYILNISIGKSNYSQKIVKK